MDTPKRIILVHDLNPDSQGRQSFTMLWPDDRLFLLGKEKAEQMRKKGRTQYVRGQGFFAKVEDHTRPGDLVLDDFNNTRLEEAKGLLLPENHHVTSTD